MLIISIHDVCRLLMLAPLITAGYILILVSCIPVACDRCAIDISHVLLVIRQTCMMQSRQSPASSEMGDPRHSVEPVSKSQGYSASPCWLHSDPVKDMVLLTMKRGHVTDTRAISYNEQSFNLRIICKFWTSPPSTILLATVVTNYKPWVFDMAMGLLWVASNHSTMFSFRLWTLTWTRYILGWQQICFACFTEIIISGHVEVPWERCSLGWQHIDSHSVDKGRRNCTPMKSENDICIFIHHAHHLHGSVLRFSWSCPN